MSSPPQAPSLVKASTLPENDHGVLEWDSTQKSDLLKVSNENRTVEWPGVGFIGSITKSLLRQPAWLPIPTRARLHSGRFILDFVVDEMAEGQIGVGFMLLWKQGLDWGFFGYLGAGHSAWSYDPLTGDVVRSTKEIESGLPKFEDRRTGIVRVLLDLPRERRGWGMFSVNGVDSKPVGLPDGAVIVPAGCLLKETQRVTLGKMQYEPHGS